MSIRPLITVNAYSESVVPANTKLIRSVWLKNLYGYLLGKLASILPNKDWPSGKGTLRCARPIDVIKQAYHPPSGQITHHTYHWDTITASHPVKPTKLIRALPIQQIRDSIPKPALVMCCNRWSSLRYDRPFSDKYRYCTT